MDNKKDVYKGFRFENGKLDNITIQDTLPDSKNTIITQKMEEGKWISITGQGKDYNYIDGNPTEKSLRKATELQFDGYNLAGQDEKTLTFNKADETITISKHIGKND